jgi:hypothetical protein
MPAPPWVGTAVFLVGFFVAVPAIAVVIGRAAWVGKPKNWDRSMYWTAFALSVAASAFLLVYSQRMQADVRTWRYSLQIALFGLGVLLFGVAGGCFVGIFTYGRARGPICRGAAAGPERSTSDVESHHKLDEKPLSQTGWPDHAGRWALVFLAVTAIAMWMIVGNKWNLQDNPIASRICIAYFFFICAGPYWMLYDCWFHERKLTRKLWLFFVPGGFIWYYFEVSRPRKLTAHRHAPDL